MHKRNLEFPLNGIGVVYHGLCIYAHVPDISASCTEPARKPWGAGGALRVLTSTPKDITRNVPGLENTVLGTVPHDLQQPP